MKSIIKNVKRQLKELEEKAAVNPSITNAAEKNVKVKVQVDTSDEANEIYESDIFSAFNMQNDIQTMQVDVKIEEDIEDGSGDDKISEGGEDTVYGQGTPPDPYDETYLSLLKHSTPRVKKIKIDTDK